MVDLDRPQITIWRMRFAYCVTEATDTHSNCLLLLHCNIVTRTLLNVTSYVHSFSCYISVKGEVLVIHYGMKCAVW
jgi:hypothetical protein